MRSVNLTPLKYSKMRSKMSEKWNNTFFGTLAALNPAAHCRLHFILLLSKYYSSASNLPWVSKIHPLLYSKCLILIFLLKVVWSVNRMMQLPYWETRKIMDNAEAPFGNLKPEHEKWMKNEWKAETHPKQTWRLFLKNGVFLVVFHVVSLLIFDSIFQKNEMRNEMKNKSKTVTVNDTNVKNIC